MNQDLLDSQIFALIGEAAFDQIVAAFFRRVPGDDILGKMYPMEDLAGAQLRLRDFLIQRFGGPDHYSQNRGHPRLRMRHSRFTIDQAARDRWMKLMEEVLAQSHLPANVEQMLRAFFDDAATFMMNA